MYDQRVISVCGFERSTDSASSPLLVHLVWDLSTVQRFLLETVYTIVRTAGDVLEHDGEYRAWSPQPRSAAGMPAILTPS